MLSQSPATALAAKHFPWYAARLFGQGPTLQHPPQIHPRNELAGGDSRVDNDGRGSPPMKYSLRSLMTFSIRDLLWLTIVVALIGGWWVGHRRLREEMVLQK